MFKAWCKKQGFYNNSNLSHVLMDGGVLSVPFDRLNDFYVAYIDAVKSSEKIYVVEQKTDTFNFFLDLDYKSDEKVSFETVENICQTICDRVSKFSEKNALISVAQPKKCGELMKYGVHINWYGFVVDCGSAMALHSHIVSALNIVFPHTNWNEVVDTSVYGNGKRNVKGSGFRLPWSHKRAKHDACGGTGCSKCENGKVTQGQYKPILMYDKKLTRIHDREPSVEILHMATLRTDNKDYAVIEGSIREEGSFSIYDTKNVFNDHETQSELEAYIRKHMEGQGNTEITKIYSNDNVYLVSTTSKYCENLQRTHASNHVWFFIDGDSIRQKCFCRCETIKGRKNGFCKDFSGRKIILPDEIYKKLYPNGTVNKNHIQRSPSPKPSSNVSPTSVICEYIAKHVTKKPVIIKNILKKKTQYNVISTNTCNVCKTVDTPFIIKKKEGILKQLCKCKTREFKVIDKIIDII